MTRTSSGGPGSARHRFKVARRRLGRAVLRAIGPGLVTALASTWRTEELGVEHLEARGDGGFLIALWHGRMLLGMDEYGGRRWSVLVSPSDDGDLSEKLLEAKGFRVIRGSSSRGGARALRAMLSALEDDGAVIVTPDGPRGPMHSMNPGLAWMARATGAPVLPLGMCPDSAWHLSSWDRFTIPKPRARVAFVWGEPIRVARGGGDTELERATRAIRDGLFDVERRGFERLGMEPER